MPMRKICAHCASLLSAIDPYVSRGRTPTELVNLSTVLTISIEQEYFDEHASTIHLQSSDAMSPHGVT